MVADPETDGAEVEVEVERTVLRIDAGTATTEEVAAVVSALVAVLAAGRAGTAGRRTSAGGRPARTAWAEPAGRLGRAATFGPGGWRGSGLPR
jgi:hypothetical protein